MSGRKARAVLVAAAIVAASGGVVAPAANAASSDAWQVTAMHSQKGWKDSKPKAPILRACRTGQNSSGIGLGTPVTILTEDEQVLGTAPVTKVTLWKEVGKWICRFSATVPMPANATSIYLVRTGDSPALMVVRGDVKADGWTVTYWPN
jgi:hypothetical protein